MASSRMGQWMTMCLKPANFLQSSILKKMRKTLTTPRTFLYMPAGEVVEPGVIRAGH